MRFAVIALVACGSSSDQPVKRDAGTIVIVRDRLRDASLPDAPPDGPPSDPDYKFTGAVSGEAVAKEFLAAASRGDSLAMRKHLVDVPANEHFYDCSARPDYHLPQNTSASIEAAVSTGLEWWRHYKSGKVKVLSYEETKQPRVAGGLSGVCRNRISFEIAFGTLVYDYVDSGKHTKYSASFIFITADGAYRLNTVTL